MSELPYEVGVKFTCGLCWQQFDSAVALMDHEACEDDRAYPVDGYPSTKADTI